MKTCIGCKYADWKRTAAGKLHPSGDGMCAFKIKPPVLPAAFYWLLGNPRLNGGYINRKRQFEDHCPCYASEEPK